MILSKTAGKFRDMGFSDSGITVDSPPGESSPTGVPLSSPDRKPGRWLFTFPQMLTYSFLSSGSHRVPGDAPCPPVSLICEGDVRASTWTCPFAREAFGRFRLALWHSSVLSWHR